MLDVRLIKQVVFGKMDGKNNKGRPKRRRMDNLVDWWKKDINTLYRWAMDRTK